MHLVWPEREGQLLLFSQLPIPYHTGQVLFVCDYPLSGRRQQSVEGINRNSCLCADRMLKAANEDNKYLGGGSDDWR